MDVLTFETCWAVNSEMIKQVTSSWSIFIQQQEKAKWTGAVILYVALHCLFAPLGPLLNACTTLLWGPEGRVHLRSGWCLSLLTWPTLKMSSSFEPFEGNEPLDAWPLVVGRSGCRCDTPGSSCKTSLFVKATAVRSPCFVTLAFPNQFRYSV